MSRAEALFDCVGESVDEISFRAGDIITDGTNCLENEQKGDSYKYFLVVKADDAGWMKGRTPNGAIGLFPANYVKIEDRVIRTKFYIYARV